MKVVWFDLALPLRDWDAAIEDDLGVTLLALEGKADDVLDRVLDFDALLLVFEAAGVFEDDEDDAASEEERGPSCLKVEAFGSGVGALLPAALVLLVRWRLPIDWPDADAWWGRRHPKVDHKVK